MKFVDYFNSLYKIPENAVSDIPDETIICRCEDIKMGEIKKGIDNGFTTPKGLKTAVRISMGNCQGRICGPVIYDILKVLAKQEPEILRPFGARPPLKPVSIGALAKFGEKNISRE
jgi:NAD(P)H-nitrite reductase large subunit